jgi:L-alanine-DL-glutamate epimerase-like enolase superfamily enzyme
LDANGAFTNETALEKLKRLSDFSIHSIEQPIKPKQFSEMAKICELSPLPIALDEELIGVNLSSEREKLLDTIKPHFLILKPSLLGGFNDSNEWIYFAEKRNIKWWATSALESNVGLNAIAQWVATKENNLRQGLGTGMLFSNNIQSPLDIEGDELFLKNDKSWDLNFFNKNI